MQPDEQPTQAPEGPFRSILVPYDGSPHAELALERAIELARRDHAWLTLMFVAFHPDVDPGSDNPWLEEEARRGEQLLERAAARVPEGIPHHTLVRRGHVADELLRRVEAAEHDLVVMGSRGFGPARALLLGSVSRRVVHRSPVPVIAVHCERREPQPRSNPFD
jgi:nucleotide-binding universal stress UspA family protein